MDKEHAYVQLIGSRFIKRDLIDQRIPFSILDSDSYAVFLIDTTVN